LLPYCEQRALFDKFDIAAGAYAPENAPVRNTHVETFTCPSSRRNSYGYSNEGVLSVAQGNYVACYNDSEAPIDVKNNGLMFLNSRIRFTDIYDGSTNTLLLSEVTVPQETLGWVSGTRATLRNASTIEIPGPTQANNFEDFQVDGETSAQDSLFVGGFSSDHSGGVNAAFADGSSRFIAESLDPSILRLYGNRADGEIIPSMY
jgi:prepilin-type processing-associated H-X9-DG protein